MAKSELFDRICGMYLQTPEALLIADEISVLHEVSMEPQHVEEIRKESAIAASLFDDVDVRRRWMWRFSEPTANNLVREYMFLIKGTDFHVAKLELGEEIEGLLEAVPADNLLKAINDAIGRQNVDWQAVLELVAYHQAGVKLRGLSHNFASLRGRSEDAFLKELASELTSQERGFNSVNDERSEAFVATKLGQELGTISTDDLAYLRSLVSSNIHVAKKKIALRHR